MSESQRPHHKYGKVPDTNPPAYWKRAHRDWRFWVSLSLMLLAITVYLLSDNLAFLPHA
jgi:hypothetical protein